MAVEKVIQICDKLSIDVKTFEPINSISEFNYEEKDIIKKYRLLDEGGKGRIKNQLEYEVSQQAQKAENKEERLA